MTHLTRTFAAALLAATAIVGVGATAPTAAFAQTVLRLDEVAVGELDPGKASDYADSMLMFNVYDTLVFSKQGEPGYAPHLAKSWKQEGNDYVFTLRDDVKFASGNPLRAEDVVWSRDRMKALGQGLSFLFKNVDSAEAVDEHTVRFHLTEPYAPFIAALVRLPIVDKKLVMEHLGEGEGENKDWGQGWLATHSAGSGAYVVVSHNPQSETVMEKNKDYFLGIPDKAPDQVRLRYSLEAASVRTMITQGKHDISSQWLPPEVLKSLAADGAQLLTERTNGAFYIKMNTAKPPLDDVNCRLALSSAYDYAAGLQMVSITDKVAQGSPSTGAIPVGMLGANPADQTLKRDLEAAKAHLAKCKYKPSDFTLEISWIGAVPLEERYALLMQANFSEIGIKSKITKVPWALFTEQVTKPENTPNISQVFVNAVTGDPDTLFYPMYHSSAAGTWQSPEYLKDAKVDEYLETGRTATSTQEREKAYSALNDRLMELAPTIYAYDQQAVFAASDRVKVPALSDPSKAFNVAGMGFTFRLMDMTGK
jgi:peptide/nickel transport system substrate-binding protein